MGGCRTGSPSLRLAMANCSRMRIGFSAADGPVTVARCCFCTIRYHRFSTPNPDGTPALDPGFIASFALLRRFSLEFQTRSSPPIIRERAGALLNADHCPNLQPSETVAFPNSPRNSQHSPSAFGLRFEDRDH